MKLGLYMLGSRESAKDSKHIKDRITFNTIMYNQPIPQGYEILPIFPA